MSNVLSLFVLSCNQTVIVTFPDHALLFISDVQPSAVPKTLLVWYLCQFRCLLIQPLYCQYRFYQSFKTNSVARTLKKLRTSKGDYCIKQWFSIITSLFKMGTSPQWKNLLPEEANSFLWRVVPYDMENYFNNNKMSILECYYFYYARAYTAKWALRLWKLNWSKYVKLQLKYSNVFNTKMFMFVLSLHFTERKFLHKIFSEVAPTFLHNMG